MHGRVRHLSILILFIFFIAAFASCSSTKFHTKEDYSSSRLYLQNGSPEDAKRHLPSTEQGFIHTMEKTYLNLLTGNPDIDELLKYAKYMDQRVRFSASQELLSFFYVKSPDGYYASEHEVIWMHLLLCWGHILRNDYESAQVDAKKASFYLQAEWSAQGSFDDPTMRILLAWFWTVLGRWDDARVDLRMAGSMHPSLKWATELSQLENPPDSWNIILAGTGPEPVWDPNLSLNPIRGIREPSFPLTNKNYIFYSQKIKYSQTPESAFWYQRHLVRNNSINDLIEDSHYGGKLLYSTIKAGIKTTAGVVGGTLVAIGGVAIGGAIIYYGQSGDAAALGVAIALGGIKWGYDIAKSSIDSSIETAAKELDTSGTYRYVRFLPDYLNSLHVTGKKNKIDDFPNNVFPLIIKDNYKLGFYQDY